MCEFYVYGTLDYAYKLTTHKCRGFIQGFSKPPLFPLFCLPPLEGICNYMPGTMYTKAWRAGGCESADKRKETNQDNENKG